MEEERSHMTERILHLTLEIIYLLTGEIYGPLKEPRGCVTPRYHSHITGWWNRNKSPTMEPPSSSLTSERNDKKILEVTQKIIELLMGEVPIRCQDVTVYFSMEEWEYIEGHKDLYKDVMMENWPPLTSPDGSSNRNPPERCPRPLYSRDPTLEDQEIPQEDQNDDLIIIEVEAIDKDDTDERGDEWDNEEELPPEISTALKPEDMNDSQGARTLWKDRLPDMQPPGFFLVAIVTLSDVTMTGSRLFQSRH
ncbi:hypothetical protein AB205_0100050 [Aquarana catesbeiana]|uniref:KRAB domain-containing protein n=2 Tax=Aquarana catesbeiana TaxID=8400 RepID=A0A2G9RPU8_AQUCT|nr:hypothetical protein AB205_0100050 [Aquarana catesbeiana]